MAATEFCIFRSIRERYQPAKSTLKLCSCLANYNAIATRIPNHFALGFAQGQSI